MASISRLQADRDLIPLPQVLEDSMQGAMENFEVITARVTDADGAHDMTAHLLAAAPNRSYLEMHSFGLNDDTETPQTVVEGHVTAPEKPGHGGAFDRGKLERCRA